MREFTAFDRGLLICLDADTGEVYWQHDLESPVWCASPVVADGNVYIGTDKNVLWVLKAGKSKDVLKRSKLKSTAITPMVKDGTFFLPTQKRLFAVKING